MRSLSLQSQSADRVCVGRCRGAKRPGLGADYTVHVVEPAITNHLILEDGPLPPVCKEIKTMKLWASRGEVGDHYEMGRP